MSDNRKGQARRRIPAWVGGPLGMASLIFLVGLVFITTSLLPGDSGLDAGWGRDVLMTLGATFLLFGPLYFVTRRMDRHLDQMATQTREQVEDVRSDTAEQVESVRSEVAETSSTLTAQVEALREEVGRSLADISQRVTARLDEEAKADTAAFESLRSELSRETAVTALSRARSLGLISSERPPRVMVGQRDLLYASVAYQPEGSNEEESWVESLRISLENPDGEVWAWIEWSEEQTAEDVHVELGRAFAVHSKEPFDPAKLFDGLADLLEAALSAPERRRAIELCPPQWMLCDWGVVTYGRPAYGVEHRRLPPPENMARHVATKAWIDLDSWDDVCSASRSLFP